jgi:hypothetical protein
MGRKTFVCHPIPLTEATDEKNYRITIKHALIVLLCGRDFFGKDEQYATEESIFFIASIFRSYS